MIGQAQRIYQLNKSYQTDMFKGNNCSFLSISSGKGGTGKSFIALNLAHTLALKGKKILLVDFDINFSNLNVILDIFPQFTLSNFFMQQKLLDEIIEPITENLDGIFGDSGKTDFQIDKDDIHYFFEKINNLTNRYDFVIFDTASGGSKETLEILKFSNRVALVLTPEPTSVMDSYAIVKLLKKQKKSLNIFVIINKYFKYKESLIAFENLDKSVKHFLKEEIKFLGDIKHSKEAIKSIMAQNFLYHTNPHSKLLSQFEAITVEFLKYEQMANNTQ